VSNRRRGPKSADHAVLPSNVRAIASLDAAVGNTPAYEAAADAIVAPKTSPQRSPPLAARHAVVVATIHAARSWP
jgi:hypothetical protein